MGSREDYFHRVRPVMGRGLAGRKVAATDLNLTGRVVGLLADCRLDGIAVPLAPESVGWPLPMVCRGPALDRAPACAQDLLWRYMRFRNGFEPIRFASTGPAELNLAGRLLEPGQPAWVEMDAGARRLEIGAAEGDTSGYLEASWLAAHVARGLLAGQTPWSSARLYCGDADWPFSRSRRRPEPASPIPLGLSGAHLMVIGVGSLGSELVRLTADETGRYTLVDPGTVSAYNPVRQWFGTEDIGRSKVACLAQRLAPARVRAVPKALGEDCRAELAALIAEDRPDLVVLASGTADHGPLAEVLWELGVPHLAACAYPRAQFFEIAVVLPAVHTPCLGCFRGHLDRGPEPEVPLTDELAHFLYQRVDPADRDRAWQELVAEPATHIETIRAAEVAALAAAEMLALQTAAAQEALHGSRRSPVLDSPVQTASTQEPLADPADRRPWFNRLVAQGTTCLLGATTPERRDGQWAYGLSYPGQVVRLGLGDLMGAEDRFRCPTCGRELEIDTHLGLPTATGADIDLALLG